MKLIGVLKKFVVMCDRFLMWFLVFVICLVCCVEFKYNLLFIMMISNGILYEFNV